MRFIRFEILAILFLFSCHENVFSQITATNSDFDTIVNYPSDTSKRDPLFVFHSPLTNGARLEQIPGQLNAQHRSGYLADFKWMKFNNESLEFDTILIDTSKLVSIFNDPLKDNGCYRIEVVDTTDSLEIHTCWLYIDHFYFILNLSASDEFRCQGLYFDVVFDTAKHFTYYDIYDTLLIKPYTVYYNLGEFKGALKTETGEPETISNVRLPKADIEKEDTEYEYEVINEFDNTQEAYYFYESWMPDIKDRVDTTHSAKSVEDGFFAPDEVVFINNGENFDSIMWLFGDTITPGYKDDSTFTDILDQNTYRFIYPGNYHVVIYAKNNIYGCLDSMEFDIKIVESEINRDEIPNVFTPNGDGNNDEWIIKGKSIKYFRILIFDRWGRKVYENEKNNNTDEELIKWDGTMNGEGGRNAPNGVYFFVIEAEGWDGKTFGGKKKKSKEEKLASETEDEPGTTPGQTSKKTDEKYPYNGYFYLLRDNRMF